MRLNDASVLLDLQVVQDNDALGSVDLSDGEGQSAVPDDMVIPNNLTN